MAFPRVIAAFAGALFLVLTPCAYAVGSDSPCMDTLSPEEQEWALFKAASEGDLPGVKACIAFGLSVNMRRTYGNGTPLTYAALGKQLDVMRYLIEQNADVNLQDDAGGSAVFYAAASGSFEAVTLLAAHGADLSVRRNGGDSVLHAAVKSGNAEMVRFLLEKGLDVNAQDACKVTAMDLAVRHPGTALVKLLADQPGFDWEIRRDGGRSFLFSAASAGNLEALRFFVESGIAMDALPRVYPGGYFFVHEALRKGNCAVLAYLIAQKMDLLVTSDDGETVLHVAAGNPDVTVMQALIDRGFAVNAPDAFGRTPLHHAALMDNPAGIRFLIGQGADINAMDNEKKTPADYACGEAAALLKPSAVPPAQP